MARRCLFLLFFAGIGLASAETPLPYTDTNSVQALRNLEKISAKDPKKCSEAEGAEWARARFAWIALLRLEGKEKQALNVFSGCGKFCEKWGPEKEWPALKAWGCARIKDKEICKKLK